MDVCINDIWFNGKDVCNHNRTNRRNSHDYIDAQENVIVLIDSSGQGVYRNNYNGTAVKLNELNLKQGIYFINVLYKGKRYQEKLLIG